jgi:hypothetical protein
MAKVTIPNAFANAVTSIPLSQLDADFNAVATSINNANIYSNYAADTGVADAYVVTLTGVTATYAAGLRIQFKATNTNTGASTLNVNGLGVKAIKLTDGATLPSAAILANSIADVIYDGTDFQLLNDASGSSEVISNLTVTGTATINALNTGNATITGGTLSNVTITSVVGGLPVSSGGTGQSTLPANNLLVGNGTSPVTGIAPGSVGNVLVSNGTNWYASPVAGTGDVTGPGSSTNNAIVRWSGITGTGIKNSITDLDDLGNMTVRSIGFTGGTVYAINFNAPGTLGANLNFTFPDTYGAAGYALTSNGSGGLSWSRGGISEAKVYFMGQF